RTTKLVVNGAGASGIACVELLKALGLANNNVILCDTKGVVYKGRKEGMNQWKSGHAVETKARTLADAIKGADVVFGLSAKGAFTPEMSKSMAATGAFTPPIMKRMAAKPIIFAMATPRPEITAEDVSAVREDAIMATGRS